MQMIPERLPAEREFAPVIQGARIYALARGARPATPIEQNLIEIVEAFDYFGWRKATAFGKQILLERAAKVMARGLYQPVFAFTVELPPAAAPARRGFFSRFRRAA